MSHIIDKESHDKAEFTNYVNAFILKRFPDGLDGKLRLILMEIVIDAYHDGARWAETALREDDAKVKAESMVIYI